MTRNKHFAYVRFDDRANANVIHVSQDTNEVARICRSEKHNFNTFASTWTHVEFNGNLNEQEKLQFHKDHFPKDKLHIKICLKDNKNFLITVPPVKMSLTVVSYIGLTCLNVQKLRNYTFPAASVCNSPALREVANLSAANLSSSALAPLSLHEKAVTMLSVCLVLR